MVPLLLFSLIIAVVQRRCQGDRRVLAADTTLTLPDNGNGPVLATITGYVNKKRCRYSNEATCELPIYKSYDRDLDEHWDQMIDELLLSKVQIALMHGRGCHNLQDPNDFSSSGNMCPKLLERFVAAAKRAGVEDIIKVGMWDDTGMYPYSVATGEGTTVGNPVDLSNENLWKYFWDHNMKIWFDTMPKSMWYLMDGRPVVTWWNLRDAFFKNQQGNASRLLSFLRNKFKARYGMNPYFIVDRTWVKEDTTITTAHAQGAHDWFNLADKSNPYREYTWNGGKWGTIIPGFRDGNTIAGCGQACREYLRGPNGETLDEGLARGSDAKFILLEGWTNVAESAGFYRSHDPMWKYPNQYINIVRKHADPEPASLRFEAEGADRFLDTTSANIGNEYRLDGLDVVKIKTEAGKWAVGHTEANEWLEYREVELGCGTYRFTGRASTASSGKSFRFQVISVQTNAVVKQATVAVPNTGDWQVYDLVHIGEFKLVQGAYHLRVNFVTGGTNLDWFFLKRTNRDCTGNPPQPSSQPSLQPVGGGALPTPQPTVQDSSVEEEGLDTSIIIIGASAAVFAFAVGTILLYRGNKPRGQDGGRGQHKVTAYPYHGHAHY